MKDAPATSMPRGGAAAPGWWAAGLALAERVPGHPRRSPTESARQRLASWRDAHGLGDGGLFATRLADLGLGEDDLLSLLAEPAEDLAARIGPPGWAAFTDDVLATPAGPAFPPARTGPGPSPASSPRSSTGRTTCSCGQPRPPVPIFPGFAPSSAVRSPDGWSGRPVAPWSSISTPPGRPAT